MFKIYKQKFKVVISAAALSIFAADVSSAQSFENYFEGKEIDLYIGFSAGGGYDTYARLVGEYMAKHIPGNPTIVARQMTGGGSRTLARFMAEVAPSDGTAIATTEQGLPLLQTLGEGEPEFDNAAFNYIGNPIADNNLVVTWHESPIKTFEDTREQAAKMGGTAADISSFLPMAMNEILGTKFELILGYAGGSDINLAMQQGEVDGRGANTYSSYKATTKFIDNNELNYLVQAGLQPQAELPDVPLLHELADNDVDQAALRLLSAPTAIGRPLHTAPGTPDEVVQILRDAFDATMEDPDFIAAAERAGLALNPVSGAELQQIVDDVINASPEASARLRTALDSLLPK